MRVALVVSSVLFATGVGLFLYGAWLPSTINPFWEAYDMAYMADPILARATGFKVVGGVVAAVGVFVLLAGRRRALV